MSRFLEHILETTILAGIFYAVDATARSSERKRIERDIDQMSKDWEIQKLKEELEALKKINA